MDELARLIGYKEVRISELEQENNNLVNEVVRRDQQIAELRAQIEPPLEVTDPKGLVMALNAAESSVEIGTRVRALEASKNAQSLADVPIHLTPDALNDKNIQ